MSWSVRLLGAVVLLAVAAILALKSGLNPDVAYFLEVARRMREGTPLYVASPGAFVEVNPPLVVWTLLPAIWLARQLGLMITAAPALLVTAEACVGIGLSIAVTRRAPRDAQLMPWLIALGGLVLAMGDFGQREHQLVLLLSPALVALAVAPRADGLSRRLRVAIGLAAGVGLSFKPYFVIAWALTEIVVAALDRHPRQLLRLESVVAAAVVAVYGISVMALTPEYLPLMKIWGPLYLRMQSRPISRILSEPESIGTLSVLLVALSIRSDSLRARAAVISSIAATMFLGAVVMQHKGLNYHYFPAFAFSSVSLLLSVGEYRRCGKRPRLLLLIGVASTVMLSVIGMKVLAGLLIGREKQRLTTAYAAALASDKPIEGDAHRFVVLSTTSVHSFPMATNLGIRWPIRFPSLWALETSTPDGCMPARARDLAIERTFTDDLWQDLRRTVPEIIIVAPLPPTMHPREGCRTVVDHLSRDQRFAVFFAQYAVADTIPRVLHGPFVVLRRRAGSR